MGSLMSGWDSPAHDLKADKLRRNSSLTKGEIDAFWRSKKQTQEEHLRHVSSLSPRTQKDELEVANNIRYQRSISMPRDTGGEIKDDERSTTLEKIIQKNGWWASSNLAFLNEPPVIAADGPNYKYASHYHVASKPNSQAGVGA